MNAFVGECMNWDIPPAQPQFEFLYDPLKHHAFFLCCPVSYVLSLSACIWCTAGRTGWAGARGVLPAQKGAEEQAEGAGDAGRGKQGTRRGPGASLWACHAALYAHLRAQFGWALPCKHKKLFLRAWGGIWGAFEQGGQLGTSIVSGTGECRKLCAGL